MKPPPFAYHAPDTVEAATELLASGDDARVLAGGQSLVQQMKFRLAKPAVLIDINRVTGLDSLERNDGELRLGALVRQQTLLEDELVARSWPLLRQAVSFVGYAETRRRGTVAGSLAFAAPWGELTAAAVALDAKIDVRSAGGERTIEAREFFRAPHETELRLDELIVGVRFPELAAGCGTSFHEVSTRHRDYAQLAVAAIVWPDRRAELVLLLVARSPHRVDATAALDDPRALDELLEGIEPPDDLEASAAYRRRVAPVLARRALHDAARVAERGEA